ncbi:MAG: NfeD family protein [Thermoplasmatota archaeon]
MMDWIFYVYAVIGLASLVILILMMVFGGLDLGFDGADIDLDIDADMDLDAGGGDIGVFSLPIILSFTTAFGALGAILTYFDAPRVATPFISAIASLALAGILFLIVNYFFKHFQSDSTVRFNQLIGRKASVTVPIAPGQEGQIVLFTEQRGRTLIPATSATNIPSNAQVVVTGVSGDTVKVVTLSEWRKRQREKKAKGNTTGTRGEKR